MADNYNDFETRNLFKVVLHELGENPYHRLNVAFALMVVIPFLVFFYLLVVEFFNFDVLVGRTGLVIATAIVISVGGYFLSYQLVKNMIERVLSYIIRVKREDQIKSSFVTSVAHEFRTPITVIELTLSNILAGLAGGINETQADLLRNCREVIARLAILVKDLLELHNVEAGISAMRRELGDIRDIMDEQIDKIGEVIREKRVEVVKEITDEDLSAWVDVRKIGVVVWNLLDNALKCTPEGGRITLRAFSGDNLIRMEVIDSGPCIPQERLDKIFDKFDRIELGKEKEDMGLVISKDIVEYHSGRLWAEPKSGQGNKFVLVLPKDLRNKPRK